MQGTPTITLQVIESLYSEALLLSDEVRAAFVRTSDSAELGDAESNPARLALSCEGLRTITRMMHAVAWVLNCRAYFTGAISEQQLRRTARLSDFPGADNERLKLLPQNLCELIGETENFHRRLKFIDQNWRDDHLQPINPVDDLRARLNAALAG